MNTEPLRRPGTPTVCLVVFNTGMADAPPCRVRFTASFASSGSHPVAVWDDARKPVFSRIVSDSFESPAEAPGRRGQWTLVLEFVVASGLPANSARAFAASYEVSDVASPDWETLPLRIDLSVLETACHPGDLPTYISPLLEP